MRVLHVIGSISAVHGGTSAAVWSMLRALRDRGILADLVTTDDDGRGRVPQALLGRFQSIDDQRVCLFPRQTAFYASSLPLRRWLRNHVVDYDLVHAHGLFSFAPVVAALAARRRGVPYIVCPHGVLNRWGRRHARPRLKQLSMALLERRILESASRVHFTSRSERRQAEDLGVSLRAAVVPLAVDMRDTPATGRGAGDGPPGVADARPGAGRGAECSALFVGRIVQIKRVDLLLAAFALIAGRHPAATLVIAGSGPDDLVQALRRQAESLGITRRVSWPGFVAAATRDRLLDAAGLFVLPSESENFGLSAAEAMARGLPVVVSAGVGISDDIAEAGAGLVCGDTAASLADCLDRLLADPALRQRMGEAGRRMVRERLSSAALGERLERLYGHALAADTP